MSQSNVAEDTILFETRDLRVRFTAATRGEYCAVSFCSFTDEPRLDRSGFGESFLRSRGYNAIHVINRTNVWYQYPEMREALGVIRNFAANFPKVFTYGSSMGGYAALRFAEAIGAGTAIAISPQFSVVPDVVPFDRRWRAVAKPLSFPLEMSFAGSQQTEALIFYDPKDLDARHFELISRAFPNSIGVRLKHAGHPAGGFLSEVGLLSTAITEVLEGRFDANAFETEAWQRRRKSGHYLFTLARRQPPWRPQTKRLLATLAVNRQEDAAYLIYKALLIEQSGLMGEAEALLRRADEILPDHPAPLRALGVFLLRNDRRQEAIIVFESLLMHSPSNNEFQSLFRLAIWSCGDLERLSRFLAQAVGGDPIRQRPSPSVVADRIGAWLFLHGLSWPVASLARSYCGLHIARKTSVDRELRLMDEWRPKPLRQRLLERFKLLASHLPKNLRVS